MIHWSYLLPVAIIAYVLGNKHGWNEAMRIVYEWRRQSHDWRFAFEFCDAESDEARLTAMQRYRAALAKIDEQEAA